MKFKNCEIICGDCREKVKELEKQILNEITYK